MDLTNLSLLLYFLLITIILTLICITYEFHILASNSDCMLCVSYAIEPTMLAKVEKTLTSDSLADVVLERSLICLKEDWMKFVSVLCISSNLISDKSVNCKKIVSCLQLFINC